MIKICYFLGPSASVNCKNARYYITNVFFKGAVENRFYAEHQIFKIKKLPKMDLLGYGIGTKDGND